MSKLTVLVLEDDDAKRRAMVQAVLAGDPGALVSEASCVIDARILLAEKAAFDLMILDIALPTYPAGEPVRDAGANLLREIMDYELYPHPRYLIGVTGFADLSALFDAEFRDRFWRLLSTATNGSWASQITRFVSHLSTSKFVSGRQSIVDVCLLTALATPEMDAVLALPWDWQEPIQLDESTYYRIGEFRTAGGRTVSVAAGCAVRMGPVSASILAAKFVSSLRPRLVGLAGICAGVRGATELGDIIAASEAWSWESGKLLGASGRPFAPEPVSVSVPEVIIAALQQLQQDRLWLDSVRAGFHGERPRQSLELRIAPIACGAPVVADSEVVSRICGVNRKTAGIEMESFGALLAVQSWGGRQVMGFCIKSVCDFADEHKDDSWRAYAAYTSSKTVEQLLVRFGDTLLVE